MDVVGMRRRVELLYMIVMSRQTTAVTCHKTNVCFSNILAIAVVTSHKIVIDEEVITGDDYDNIKSH